MRLKLQFSFVTSCLFTSLSIAAPEKANRPNIVVVLADDMG